MNASRHKVLIVDDTPSAREALEELLLPEWILQRVWLLRGLLHPLNVIDSMEFLLDKISRTESNQEFLESMHQ